MNEFEMKQLKDRVGVAMSACDSANKLKVRTLGILNGRTIGCRIAALTDTLGRGLTKLPQLGIVVL